ncbi:SIMPL domain-containing protein [Sphingomonas sp. BIUV-7]|uniref:SIMPL domain-containing protein n=1 Tax=Sphingomonas natans TaxID=3063330 RepID=A0ABT8YBQ0_9SPHN|nr:SIMPL domain-containing protein [Sphingomonas sp. BIUV-7]MDO6415756.1 SIMPL domain-containing protein [Sphingomonas sp. BIUV-7]
MLRFAPIALAAILPVAAAQAQDAAPGSTLHGTRLDIAATGEVTRAPDVATISAGVVTQSGTASKAMADNAQRMTATIAALRKAGVADRDIRTASLRLSPQYRYQDNQPPVLTGYQASNQVSVRFREIAHAGSILDALVAAGANQIDGPSFTVDKPEPALDEARTQALATAKARAELYARAAGLHVKRIVRIGESGGAEPPIRPMMMMARAKGDSTPVEPGEETLSITLQVTFELE